MKARLMALGIPAFVVGSLFVGAFTWKTMGMREDAWIWVWPALVAVAFLALAIGAFIVRMQRVGWPLLVGFLAQAIGILLLVWKWHRNPWVTLWWTLWIFGAAAFLVLLLWVWTYVQARRLERNLVKGVALGGADPQKVAQIQKDMMATLALLRKAGAGRNAIFELPWFLFIGRSQAGKTVAIKNSGLGLPVRKDRLKGLEGTHSVDWFFTSDVIFVDTPGAWTTEGADDEAREYWKTLLRLLRKFRGRRPLDGLLVVVPADDLLSKDRREIQEQAGHAREVIDLLHAELRFRFPVYVLVTKCDLVDGFVDYFRSFPAQRWHEIVGWSNPDPNSGDPSQLVPKGFRRVVRRLREYRLELMARIAKGRVARRLFFFPENFRRLEEPLALFVDVLFSEDPENETPVFRGFYFTSGTQGEGSPLGDAIAEIARGLSLRVPATAAGQEEEPKRGYFLREIFRHLMVGDEGLVSHTAGHWWKRRRDTVFACFLPASLAGCVILLSLISYGFNRGTYGNVADRVPQIVRELRALGPAPTGPRFMEALRGRDGEGGLDEILGYHEAMTGFSIFRRFGMRRPGQLADETFRVFREQFEAVVLRPTLQGVKAVALDANRTCNDRVDNYYAAVWLRAGRRAEGKNDLRALDDIWRIGKEDSAEARHLFHDQFNYLLEEHDRRRDKDPLLPGFALGDIAARIRADCSRKGSESTLDAYLKFQGECRDQFGKEILDSCYNALGRALNTQGEDRYRLREQIDTLKTVLRTLMNDDAEPTADTAYKEFENFDAATGSTTACLESFNEGVATPIQDLLEKQPSLIEECMGDLKAKGLAERRQAAKESIQNQTKELKDNRRTLADKMKQWTTGCPDALKRIDTLDVDMLFNYLGEYRRCRCLGDLCGAAEVAQPTRVPSTSGSSGTKASRRVTAYTYLWAPPVPDAYRSQAWLNKRVDWEDELKAAGSEAERNEVQQKARAYAENFAQAWRSYLAQIKLKEHGLAPDWLQQLASTSEFKQVLQPAAEALSREITSGGSQLGTFAVVADLGSVQDFALQKVNDYQNHLRKAAEDLKRCSENPVFANTYKQSLDSKGNAVFDGKEWVKENAGAALASGVLLETLLDPFQSAEDYVRNSSKLADYRWDELRNRYEKARERFPLDKSGTELIDVTDLTVLFGGGQGLVAGLQDPVNLASMGEASRNWLTKAYGLTSLFFAERKDEIRPLKLQVSVEQVKLVPPEFAEDFIVREIRIEWGGGVDQYKWSEDDEDSKAPKTVTLKLFGDDASASSRLTVTPAEMVRGKLGMGRKRPEDREPCKVTVPPGPWAPLKLLAKGLPEGGALGGKDLTLIYELPFAYKRNKEGKIQVELHVSAPGIGRLLQLTQNGLEPPPQGGAP